MTISDSKRAPRKPRKGEYTCRCSAYRLPHRFGGGLCTGFSIISDHWNTFYGHNSSYQCCNSLVGGQCQVVQGIEKETECSVFQEFISSEEIRLLGRYWK